MAKRKTAGELALKAASDSTKYNALDVGYALTEDVQQQIEICIERHNNLFDEPQYCVVMQLADDPLIKGVLRRKFYGYLFIPKPRPRQMVMLYTKATNSIIRLWTLPDAMTMAIISEMVTVAPQWEKTKQWVDWFYENWVLEAQRGDHFKFKNNKPVDFFHHIRKQHGIKLESEQEFLNANREKLIQSGCQELKSPIPDPFDFSKISIDKIINTKASIA
jgi:hypothetical protein